MTAVELEQPEAEEFEAAVPPPAGMMTYADDRRAPLETEWTWQGRLPRGKVVLITGWRQSAKGLLACNIAAAVTTGRPLPGETGQREPGDVIMISAEDDPCEDMAWRLRAADADVARVHDMTFLPDGSPFELSASAADPGHTPELLEYIRALKRADRNPRLVVLDPLNALVMSGSIKTDQGARRVIGRLQLVASKTGVTIVLIHHLVESRTGGKAGKVAGSQGLEDAPRWIYRIDKDPDAPELKVFHLHKCNVAVAEDLRYRIISDGHHSRIEWVDREQIQLEERSWRQPVDDSVVLAGLERNQVQEWLKAGGGSTAQCADATGLPEAACAAILEEFKAAGTVRGRRRLANPLRSVR